MTAHKRVTKPRLLSTKDESNTTQILAGGRMRPKAAAKYLGFSLVALTKLRQRDDGGPPYHRMPGFTHGGIYYIQAELDHWLAQSKALGSHTRSDGQ